MFSADFAVQGPKQVAMLLAAMCSNTLSVESKSNLSSADLLPLDSTAEDTFNTHSSLLGTAPAFLEAGGNSAHASFPATPVHQSSAAASRESFDFVGHVLRDTREADTGAPENTIRPCWAAAIDAPSKCASC
jgi:hypothetical protein